MTMLSTNHPTRKRIEEIYNKAPSSLFEVRLVFSNMNNEKFSLEPDFIEALRIFDDFIGSCMPYIEAKFKINVLQYKELLANYTELRCNFILNTFDDEKNKVAGTYWKDQYQVLIHNMKDISQVLPQSELYDEKEPNKNMTHMKREQMVDVKIQLIKSDAYRLTKQQFSTTLKDATVSQAIWLFAESLKIKKAFIFPPDNKKKYQALEIPPFQNLNTLMGYLQNDIRYGVYDFGAGMYFDQGALYTYPILSIKGKSENTFHIYKAPTGFLLGAKGTTIFEEKDVCMFTNQLSTHQLSAVNAVEKEGNSVFSLPRSGIIDQWATHKEGNSVIQGDKPQVFNSAFGKGITEQSHSPKWHANSNNEQVVKSKLATLNVSVLDIGWQAALPFLIKPFQNIMFHYEQGVKQKSINATCAVATYSFKKEGRLNKAIFSCFASLRLFVNESTAGIS